MKRRLPAVEAFLESFGRVVRRRRQKLRLSQEELADRCGLHRTYVSLIERGMKAASIRVLLILAQALEVAPHQLVKEAEDRSGS